MRYRAALGLFLTAALTMTACAKQVPTGPGPGAEPVQDAFTIAVMAGGDTAPLDALIAAFHGKYPNARVAKVNLPYSEHWAEQMRRLIDDGEVDVIPTFHAILPAELVAGGLLLPLEPYLQKSRFDLKPLGAGVDGLRYDGKLYDLPVQIEPFVILYNKSLFQKKGVPLPRPGWTWEEFRAAAVQLTEGEGDMKTWGVADPDPKVLTLNWLFQQAGDQFFTDELAMRDALRFFSTLMFSDRAALPSEPMESQVQHMHHLMPFKVGRGGMTSDSLFGLKHFQPNAAFEWDMAPMPVIPGAPRSAMTQAFTYGIAANSREPDGAWAFLQFAAGPEGAAALAKAGYLPTWRSPDVKAAWFQQSPAPSAATEALFDLDWYPVGRSIDRAREEIAFPLLRALSTALSGQQSWEDAHAEFVREVRQLTGGN